MRHEVCGLNVGLQRTFRSMRNRWWLLDDETHGADIDLAFGQLLAQGFDDRLGDLVGSAVAEREVGRPV